MHPKKLSPRYKLPKLNSPKSSRIFLEEQKRSLKTIHSSLNLSPTLTRSNTTVFAKSSFGLKSPSPDSIKESQLILNKPFGKKKNFKSKKFFLDTNKNSAFAQKAKEINL